MPGKLLQRILNQIGLVQRTFQFSLLSTKTNSRRHSFQCAFNGILVFLVFSHTSTILYLLAAERPADSKFNSCCRKGKVQLEIPVNTHAVVFLYPELRRWQQTKKKNAIEVRLHRDPDSFLSYIIISRSEILKIGRVLGPIWAVCSLRSAVAVWRSYVTLYHY